MSGRSRSDVARPAGGRRGSGRMTGTHRRRGGFFAVVAVGAALFIGAPAQAQDSETPAEQAAREIGEARDRANAAAEAWAQAEADLDALIVQTAKTEQEIIELEVKIAALETRVQEVAINRFVSGSTGGIPLLNGLEGPTEQAQADVLASIATDTSADTFDDYEAVAEELDAKRAELRQQQKDTVAAQEYLDQVQDEAYAEIERVRQVEEQRLKDEAVRKALEAQQAEKQRLAEEQARQELAAQQAARQAAQGADPDATPGDATAGSSSGASGTPPPPTAPPTAGGTTGGSGTGIYTGGGYVDSIVCPVSGPSAFADTWGAPRSGGRRHEGVDMLGALGTPLVAVVSGYVQFKTNALGGNAVGLNGANGNYYYYAHLDSWAGSSRNVSQGEVIGYMGDTGNATGTVHLHFEIHPGGGSAVNPYPSVRAAC